jgi:hypothetical protein
MNASICSRVLPYLLSVRASADVLPLVLSTALGEWIVVQGNVHEQFVEIHILLEVRADQIVEGVAGDGQHGLTVILGVVQTIEQVNAARPGGGHADPQRAGRLGVTAGRERCRFLMTNLHELDLVFLLSQRLEKAVDTIAG